MELILIRHGLPVRVDNSDTGEEADPSLSPLGERQAQALAEWFIEGPGAQKIDAIYSSPKKRAFETVQPLAKGLGQEITIEPRVVEYDAGETAYIPIEEIKGEPEWYEMIAAGIPDPKAFQEQVIDGLESIISNHSGDRVVVGCHGGVIAVYLAHLMGVRQPLFFEAHYTSINRVMGASTGERSVVSMNELGHLQVANVPLSSHPKS